MSIADAVALRQAVERIDLLEKQIATLAELVERLAKLNVPPAPRGAGSPFPQAFTHNKPPGLTKLAQE